MQIFIIAVGLRLEDAEEYAKLVESAIEKGWIKTAELLWRGSPFFGLSPTRCTEKLQRAFHARVARAFMASAELGLARRVLESIPAVKSPCSEIQDLWNRVQFRLEARNLPVSLFPEDGVFAQRWTPQSYGAPAECRELARVRYLGRLHVSDDLRQVQLVIAEAPDRPADDFRPEVFNTEIDVEAFLEAANLRKLEPHMDGLFPEAVEVDGRFQVFLRPRRTLPRQSPRQPLSVTCD